ncbi:hypothetical protein ACS0TY_036231 [Phlomoides rotata]
MDLIKKEVMEMTNENLGVQVQLHRNLSISADSLITTMEVLNALQSAPRSLIVHCNSREVEEALRSANLRLLRILPVMTLFWGTYRVSPLFFLKELTNLEIMAAYAALVSLRHIIDQIEHHPRPPISLDIQQVESLIEKVTFLQDFLEGYSSHVGYSSEADALEMRIADAAYAVEDVIESHIVDEVHSGRMSSIEFYEGLQKVIEDMDLIKKEVMEMTEENLGVQIQLHRNLSISSDSRRSHSMRQSTTMMGSDDVLTEVMDKLTGQQCNLQIIPIVGMGGIGKTTLARNIYAKQLIKEHFDICAWATISQEYDTLDILKEILSQFNKVGGGDSTENELGEIIYKHLSGLRYLIIMDDMWSIEVWDRVKFFFPNNNNGSRIMITTRLSNLAFQLANSYGFQMKFLDEDRSWNIFLEIVFGKDDCLVELEEIGREIVRNCKGLPLSIVVIGGLLAKYKGT